MFDELVKQVQRLFSSKKNGGKQVAKLTDKLHYQKLVVIALAIVLLLGYSKLRDDFICQGVAGVDSQVTTRFCLINGTTTTVLDDSLQGSGQDQQAIQLPPAASGGGQTTNQTSGRAARRAAAARAAAASARGTADSSPSSSSSSQAHIGFGFVGAGQRVIHHNYMRSQWALLILLALCSYFAQRNWASLFKNDVLQALLQLEGSNELRQVRAAESAKPYEMLSNLKSDLKEELEERVNRPAGEAHLSRTEKVSATLELVDNHVNIYDHKLDYYPNQLTYLLLTRNTASYKLSCMKLRSALIFNAFMSTLYTLAQLALPLVFISNEYLLFGWRYLEAILAYLRKIYESREPLDINSIDYELSSRIFPISTQCEYKQNGMAGSMEKFTVQCTVAINEIGSKLFVVIWWYVVLSLCVEIYSLLTILLCSLSRKTVGWSFGWRYWPQARKEAELIASFRWQRQDLQKSHEMDLRRVMRANLAAGDSCEQESHQATGGNKNRCSGATWRPRRKPATLEMPRFDQGEHDEHATGCCDANEKKRLEAEEGRNGAHKSWYHYCPKDVCMGVKGFGHRLVCCKLAQRRRRIELEAERDINIYYLLYLLYLRNGKSQSRAEEIIKMTARALKNYLDDLVKTQERELTLLRVRPTTTITNLPAQVTLMNPSMPVKSPVDPEATMVAALEEVHTTSQEDVHSAARDESNLGACNLV